jgi:hypothetical protein
MPRTYFDAVASVLQSGAVFKLHFPNYSTFLGLAQGLPKGCNTRITGNLSTQSLGMVISTFQVQERDTQHAPLLRQANTDGWGTVPGAVSTVGAVTTAAASGEFGTHLKMFNYALTLGVAKTLNNSKHYVRNGDGIHSCTYIGGATRLIPETIQEQCHGVLCAVNSQNDTLGGVYPGIQGLYHYQSKIYAHILSYLNVTTEHDMYTVSGLNCCATPISIDGK